ncbi:MAG: hypothetical protein WAU78_09020 [Roseiarcus sp.]
MAAEATAEPTEARATFGRDRLFSRACVTIFRRARAASASPVSGRRPIGGLSILSPRRQAFPSFSKDFQTFPRKFQGNSKLFQGFSNFFPWPFRGKSRGCRSVEPESRFLQFFRRFGRDERPGDTPPNSPAIQYSANSDYRKEIVATIFRKRDYGITGDYGDYAITRLRRLR